MAAKTTSWLTRARVFRTLLSDIHLAIRLLREPLVPTYLKVVPFAAVAYVLSPLDFIPDFIPIVGQLDDIGFLILRAGLCEHHAIDLLELRERGHNRARDLLRGRNDPELILKKATSTIG